MIMDYLVLQAVRQFLDYRARGLFRLAYPLTTFCEFCGGPKQDTLAGGICNSCAWKLQLWVEREERKREEEEQRDFRQHMRVYHDDGSSCTPVSGVMELKGGKKP